MAKPSPILPIDSIEMICADVPLISLDQLDHFDSSQSLRMLFDILEALRNDTEPCAANVRRFNDSLTKLITGEAKDMEEAFGISRQEIKKLGHHQQTKHLRTAFDLVDCEKPGKKARAEMLAEEIRRFEFHFGNPLPTVPSPEWSGVRIRIWCARKFGPLPKSWKRIACRCDRSRQYVR